MRGVGHRVIPVTAVQSVIAAHSCARNCAHYDGDGFCALPEDDKCITGYIAQADRVVCAKWTRKDEGE